MKSSEAKVEEIAPLESETLPPAMPVTEDAGKKRRGTVEEFPPGEPPESRSSSVARPTSTGTGSSHSPSTTFVAQARTIQAGSQLPRPRPGAVAVPGPGAAVSASASNDCEDDFPQGRERDGGDPLVSAVLVPEEVDAPVYEAKAVSSDEQKRRKTVVASVAILAAAAVIIALAVSFSRPAPPAPAPTKQDTSDLVAPAPDETSTVTLSPSAAPASKHDALDLVAPAPEETSALSPSAAPASNAPTHSPTSLPTSTPTSPPSYFTYAGRTIHECLAEDTDLKFASNWTSLVPEQNVLEDHLNGKVALHGRTIVMGAMREFDAGPGASTGMGSLYVFALDAKGKWRQEAKLIANDMEFLDYFGMSVAIFDNTIVVGAPSHRGSYEYEAGAAYVFVRSSGKEWRQEAKLFPPPDQEESVDEFGASVAIHGDTVVVGAPYSSVNEYMSGSCFVYVRNGADWVPEATLLPEGGGKASDHFGAAVAVEGDTIVVGAGNAPAYVFERTGSLWRQQSKLSSFSHCTGGVGIHDGIIAVGNTCADMIDCKRAGEVNVYAKTASNWEHQALLLESDCSKNDQFGGSVAIGKDVLLVGKSGYEGENPGTVYIFVKNEDERWALRSKLVAPDGKPCDQFGLSLGVDEHAIVIGQYEYMLCSGPRPPGTTYVIPC